MDFTIKNPPEYNGGMRMLETTDPAHADIFNGLFETLINNDAFLKAVADLAAKHMESQEIHVTEENKAAWDAKANKDAATPSTDGLLGAGDKKKLDGIAESAEANQNAFSNVKVGTVTITANGQTATFTLEAGDNVTLTADNATKKIRISSKYTDTDTWKANTKDSEGYAAKGSGNANKAWKTDVNGNPGWRDDVSVTDFNNHIGNENNPHGVTKAQIGLGSVDNTADKDKSVKYATSAENASTSGTSGVAAALGRDGNAGNQMKFWWSGQNGQPSWLWGGNDASDMYVYNPVNFSVAKAARATTATNAEQLGGLSASGWFRLYGLNGIDIDNTGGNWCVDISEAGHGTLPPVGTWFNISQFSSGHFLCQIANYCDGNATPSRKVGMMWVRARYVNSQWSAWTNVYTEYTISEIVAVQSSAPSGNEKTLWAW